MPVSRHAEPFFPDIQRIEYVGPDASDELAFRHYDADREVLGKRMEDHLRFAVCYWHGFCWPGSDVFGEGTFDRPWLAAGGDAIAQAEQKTDVAFEFFRVMSIAVVAVLVGMFAWGFTGGQRFVEETRVPIEVRGLHDAHHGLRIVHLSDFHIGNGLEGERLGALVARVNAMDADLVVLTGDLFDFDPRHVEDGARRLGGLRARLGVFAVLGNHDDYTGREYVAESLGRHAPGVCLLRGEVARLPGESPSSRTCAQGFRTTGRSFC